jgi:hypothetical protein
MSRLLHIVAATLLASICIAQSGNPFDIPDRVGTIVPVEADTLVVEPTIPTKVAAAVSPSGTPLLTSDTAATSIYEALMSGDNPFNVDHVPIRRRTLERADTSSVVQRHETLGPSMASRSILFVFLIEIVSLIFIGLVLNTQRGFLSNLWRSLTNENILKLNHRDHNSSRNPIYLLMYLVFVANIAAFAFLLINREQTTSGFRLWAYLVAGVSLVYLLKHLFLMAASIFLPLKKEAQLYSFTIITYNIAVGIALIPVNMMMAFGPSSFFTPMMYLGIILIISTLLLRYLRGLTISLPHLGTNPFHFLLYICTTEIAPVLILLRIISKF